MKKKSYEKLIVLFGTVLLVGTFTLALTGCGSSSSGDPTSPPSNPAMGTGATVTKPASTTVTSTSITVGAVTLTPSNTGQTAEYAIRKTGAFASPTYQDSPAFTGLDPNTSYYVTARSKANASYTPGTAVSSDPITTSP